jgi:hypothetical protein
MIINKTLNALKKQLDEKGNMEVVVEQGNIHKIHCSFNLPIESHELEKFQKETMQTLPKDVKEFLTLHNGARMYEMVVGSANIGGGLTVYSIDEIQKAHENLQSLSEYVPIGYVFENHLLMSREAIEQEDPNYLFIAGTTLKPEPLRLNLELFLDRFVVSQGSNFWEWPHYTAKNYYKHSGSIEF